MSTIAYKTYKVRKQNILAFFILTTLSFGVLQLINATLQLFGFTPDPINNIAYMIGFSIVLIPTLTSTPHFIKDDPKAIEMARNALKMSLIPAENVMTVRKIVQNTMNGNLLNLNSFNLYSNEEAFMTDNAHDVKTFPVMSENHFCGLCGGPLKDPEDRICFSCVANDQPPTKLFRRAEALSYEVLVSNSTNRTMLITDNGLQYDFHVKLDMEEFILEQEKKLHIVEHLLKENPHFYQLI